MKIAALLCFLSAFSCAFAVVPHGHELEFRMEPSFHDGLLIWLTRLPNGEIHGSVHRLLLVEKNGTMAHSEARLLRKVKVSAQRFDALLSQVEGEDLKAYAESDEAIGMDGETWVFLLKAGRRSLEYRFWNPDEQSVVGRLGREFLRLAQIEPVETRK